MRGHQMHRTLVPLALLALVAGCGSNGTPTTPSSTVTPPSSPGSSAAESLLWRGTWTFETATPAGDCMADALNARPQTGFAPMTLAVRRTGNAITMEFWSDVEDDAGYLPMSFVGTVDQARQITASPLDQGVFSDPWSAWCYRTWTIAGGELSGMLSEDQREVSGTIVESFRTVREGAVFTVRSRFTAKSKQ